MKLQNEQQTQQQIYLEIKKYKRGKRSKNQLETMKKTVHC